ncbi:MAG TPA: efflux RND transporter periplasmic adaptor subunit [Bacteroidales bacterium]|nr:efflux RND transporter periplasmic adaptor subunit [Bacteroidales bacterium]HOR81795.1 efflux RND transporter periplasmic adaptor subunit [Bacteroidales bacterium]HPJ90972.1 efflux RND transporter periplasmic adaptor subunit [Bacteroidales bacterium]
MKRAVGLLTVAILVGVLLNACNSNKNADNQEEDEKVKIKVEQVFQKEIDMLYDYTAIVQAEAVNNIAPTIPGRIDKIYVEVGSRVSKGQLLVQMDANSLTQAKSKLDNLETTFKRINELYKVGGVSKSDWEAQQTALDVAQTAYQNLKDNTQLISPISGVVSLRNYDSGDLYAGNPILQVQQIRPVKLRINVSEMQYTKIKEGMEAKVKIEVYDNEEFTGKVSLVYPTIDPRSHTFPVEITIPNTDEKIRPGMYAKVSINMGKNNHVLVPDVSIVKQQGSGDRYVYVYKDGKVSYNKVVIGRQIGDMYEIISGVEDGDFVATTTLSKLNNGMEVELVK